MLGGILFLTAIRRTAIALLGSFLFLATIGPTAIHLPLACTIWGITGLISLVTVATALGAIAGNKPGEDEKAETGEEEKDFSEGIREHANRG